MSQRTYSTFRRGLGVACTAAALGLTVLLASTPACAADAPAAPATSRFATDAAVRDGMAAIRQQMLAQESGIRANQLGAADYSRLAQTLDAAMQAHLVRRSLPHASAVAFNGSVWQDLSYCVGLMREGRSVAVQRAGALGVQQALRNYAQYFDHPGW